MLNFWIAALIYTSLEISYWYYLWFRQLNKEPLPIVTSLLSAVFYAHLLLAINFGVRFLCHIDMLTNPIFPFLMWVGSVLHLIPIWKQELDAKSGPQYYAIRVLTFSILFAYFFKGVN